MISLSPLPEKGPQAGWEQGLSTREVLWEGAGAASLGCGWVAPVEWGDSEATSQLSLGSGGSLRP